MREKLDVRLRTAMKIRGLRQVDLVEKTGLSKSKINMYVNGEHQPKHDGVYLLAKALGVQEAWLMGYDVPMEDSAKDITALSAEEAQHIAKYRTLDDRGRAVVNYILDEECYRSQQIQEALYYADDDEHAWYIYAGKIAAAGTWIYPGDIPIERIRERRLNGADYIVGVSGDSMQPLYEDGDKLYIKKATEIEFTEIGLFVVNGMYYVKEYAPDGLRSKNPKYATIPKSQDIIVVGKVIGKVD